MEDQDTPTIEMTARDFAIPRTTNVTLSSHKPVVGRQYELSENMMQLLHTIGQFIDVFHEDRQVHIQKFLEISDTFYLLGEEKIWLNSDPTNFINSQDDLARKFFIRCFHLENSEAEKRHIKLMKKRRRKFAQTWARFKSCLKVFHIINKLMKCWSTDLLKGQNQTQNFTQFYCRLTRFGEDIL